MTTLKNFSPREAYAAYILGSVFVDVRDNVEDAKKVDVRQVIPLSVQRTGPTFWRIAGQLPGGAGVQCWQQGKTSRPFFTRTRLYRRRKRRRRHEKPGNRRVCLFGKSCTRHKTNTTKARLPCAGGFFYVHRKFFTVSTKTRTPSSGVSGYTPWPRLAMCRRPNCRIISRVSASISAGGAYSSRGRDCPAILWYRPCAGEEPAGCSSRARPPRKAVRRYLRGQTRRLWQTPFSAPPARPHRFDEDKARQRFDIAPAAIHPPTNRTTATGLRPTQPVAQVGNGGIRNFLQQVVRQGGLCVQHAPGFGERFASATFQHVRKDRPGSACKADQRHTARQFTPRDPKRLIHVF